MKLRDGRYAFGLLATIDGVQLVLAVSRAIRKESGQLFSGPSEQEIMLATVCERGDDSVGGSIAIHESSDEDRYVLGAERGALVTGDTEAEEEDEGDEDAYDNDLVEDETVAVHREKESKSADAHGGLPASGQPTFRLSRPPASGRTIAGPHPIPHVGTMSREQELSGHEVSSHVRHEVKSHVPPKKLASRRAALTAKAVRSKARWSPRVGAELFGIAAITVLSVLQKCGPCGSNALIAPTVNVLKRLSLRPTTLTPREILLETLRILVRSQILSRQRERSVQAHLPTYAIAPHGLVQLHLAAPGQSAYRLQPLEVGLTAQREQRNAALPNLASLQTDTLSQISQPLCSSWQRVTQPCTTPADVSSAVAFALDAASAPPYPPPYQKADAYALGYVEANVQEGVEAKRVELTSTQKSEEVEEAALKRKASDASNGKARYRISRKRAA